MTSTEQLWSALSRIEAVGASVVVAGNELRLVGNSALVPADARTLLRGRSTDLTAYLSGECQKPAPEWQPFVSRRLVVVELPSFAVVGVAVFWRDDQAHYRLTPAVSAWVSRFVESLGKSHAKYRDAAALAVRLATWVAAYYPPHQIWAAKQRPADLPKAVPPPVVPGAEEWARRGNHLTTLGV